MTMIIGTYSLCAAVLVAAGTLLVSLGAVRFEVEALRRTAHRGIMLLAGLLTVSSIALMVAMLQSDFRLAYVVRYTELALPTGYKAAAFWAGQEGSLLLWGWLLAAMSLLFVILHRREKGADHAAAVGTLAAVTGFFAALMLFAANPFAPSPVVPADGQGLNPMLQNPGMLSHPPILFVGYAGFTIPFALLIGALVARRSDDAWVVQARPWVLISWLFLGAGILLGAEWAYVELGWGGYWAWDPVENASLLPWLTGAALLHSIIGQKVRGMFKRWNAVLAASTFILCIFGTYITRSGVVDSVHTFGKSLVGSFFLAFLVVTILLSVVLVLRRWSVLRPDRPLEGLISREGAFVAGNVLLVAMMLVTLLGTMFPVISRNMAGQSMSVSQSFYNRAVLPMGLGLVALMALAPLLAYGSGTMNKLMRRLWLPLILAGLLVGVLFWMEIRSIWALASAAIAGTLVGGTALDIGRGVWTRQREKGESLPAALVRLIGSNPRRYGAQVAHSGIVMIVIGIAGSSIYNNEEMVQLAPGESAQVGSYSLKLDTLHEVPASNYTAVEARVTLTDASGAAHTLLPQRRFYNKSEQPNSEVAIRSSWREDLYVNLATWDPHGRSATLQVFVNPLVRWIWAGGIVMTIGALVCLTPRAGTRVQPVQQAVPAEVHGKRKKLKRRERAAVHAAH